MNQNITGSRPDRDSDSYGKQHIDVECLHCKKMIRTVHYVGLRAVAVVQCSACGTVFNRFTKAFLVKAGASKSELQRLEEKLRKTGGLEDFLEHGLKDGD